MDYLSDLDPTSRAGLFLLLSMVCVELAVFAFRRVRRLFREVRVAWQMGRMALRLRNEAREQAKQTQIDQLIQKLGAVAAISLNEVDELGPVMLVDALERILAD